MRRIGSSPPAERGTAAGRSSPIVIGKLAWLSFRDGTAGRCRRGGDFYAADC